MKITEKIAQELVEVLEEIKEECFSEEKSKYPYAEWEQKREQVKQRLRELPRYIDQAVEKIHFVKPRAGQKKKIDVRKRTMLFLLTRLMNKS
ncbi:MAG: ISNCY family transposase, partial [Candidatus Thermoplasmatota archaeon]